MDKNQLLHRAVQTEENINYAGAAELWANEASLPRYNQDIVKKLSKDLPFGAKVLEFGAGIGTLAQLWLKATGIRPVCLEIDPSLQKIIQGRGFDCHSSLEGLEDQFDLIYSSNVLEHIEDDQKALQQLYLKLKPGGVLALYLPAFQCLYSDFDAAIGHYRRYEKADLIRKLKNARFVIEKCNYADSVGFLAWLSTKWKRQNPKSKSNSNAQLRFYDQWIFPVSKTLDCIGFRYLLGKNLLVIAQK